MIQEEEEEAGGGEGWLVSYADLMTLLFAAFVVLYGITPQGVSDNTVGVMSAIRESFREIPDNFVGEPKVGPINHGLFLFKASRGHPKAVDSVMSQRIKVDQRIAFDRDKNKVDALLDQIAMTKDGFDMGLRDAMQTEVDEYGVTLKLMGAYFFKDGSYHLARESYDRITRIGSLLKELSRTFVIEGHAADGESSSLSPHSLAALRARKVADFLITNLRFPQTSIDVVSFGASRPIARGNTPDERAQNRRVEIKLRY